MIKYFSQLIKQFNFLIHRHLMRMLYIVQLVVGNLVQHNRAQPLERRNTKLVVQLVIEAATI